MKKITESELKDRVNRLREYIAVVENEQQVNEEGIANALGQLGGAVSGTVGGAYDAAKKGLSNAAGTVGNLAGQAVGGVANAAGKVANAVGGAVNSATQGVQKVAGDVAAGYKQGVASAGGQPAPKTIAAAPAGTTAGAAKSDPTVLELQKKLIAAGAKIKADGVMGPATRAAQQQFPNVTTQPAAAQAVAADLNAAEKGPATVPPKPLAPGQMTEPNTPENDLSMFNKNAAPAPAAQQQTATDLANQEKQAQANAAPPGEASYTPPAGAKPAPAPAKPAPAKPVVTGPGQTNADYAGESVEFRNDELSRIVNLVHYR